MTLTKITLTTRAGAEVELTIDEARELYAQLAEVFAPRLPPIVVERYPQPYWPVGPVWVSSVSGASVVSAPGLALN